MSDANKDVLQLHSDNCGCYGWFFVCLFSAYLSGCLGDGAAPAMDWSSLAVEVEQ